MYTPPMMQRRVSRNLLIGPIPSFTETPAKTVRFIHLIEIPYLEFTDTISTLQAILHPLTYAYIYVEPRPLPTTKPLATVAIRLFAEYHVIGSVVPITLSVSVSNCLILSDDLFSSTTLTSTVAVVPLDEVIVIVAIPVPTAFTFPEFVTVATLLLSDAILIVSV